MIVSSPFHLDHELLVAQIKSGELSFPPSGLGMEAVTAFTEYENIPQTMQLAVFAEQMAATKAAWMNVPDSHNARCFQR